jgi:transformation/transcription domain-associated protein
MGSFFGSEERKPLTHGLQTTQNPTNINNMIPVVQSAVNLISTATNPMQLMKMSEIYLPWF